ncbi:hypothetical protein [Methylovulum sp.]|uniref:hypothetical protein n=1 Tax=Methylovulum sp. TaxID=1916980 RepID=UPI00261E1657|nr:hypothetical protein [Methylovulum sp.]MDD5125381.1 hypothetical protein [Methylovulum sp.]
MKIVLRKIMRVVLWVGGTLIILLAAVSISIWQFAKGMCGNEVIAEYQSPGKKHRVVVFQRDCGATTGFSTQASILDTDETLSNESGNVFTSDTNHGATPSGLGGGPAISVEWENDKLVVFSYHHKTRVFKQEQEMDGVHISYDSNAQQGIPGKAPSIHP